MTDRGGLKADAERKQREEKERLQTERLEKERLDAEQREAEAKERLEAERRQKGEQDRLETERRERLEARRRVREEQEQPPSPVAPSTPAAKPEAEKPSAETPRVVYTMRPKPAELEREKLPPPSDSSVQTNKTRINQHLRKVTHVNRARTALVAAQLVLFYYPPIWRVRDVHGYHLELPGKHHG